MSDIKKDLKPLFDWIKTLNTTQKIFVFIGTCFAIFFIASGFGQYKADSSSSFLAWMACCVVGYYLFAPQESEE